MSSVVKMMRFLRGFFFTLFLNLHKQHNILISEGIDSLQYVHCTISSPFFSLSVYYSQVVACAVCLIPAAGRTVIADETVSSSLLLSICVYSSVILCTARGESDKSLSRGQDISISPGFLSTQKWVTHKKCEYVYVITPLSSV